jgi:hypothetical protein
MSFLFIRNSASQVPSNGSNNQRDSEIELIKGLIVDIYLGKNT